MALVALVVLAAIVIASIQWYRFLDAMNSDDLESILKKGDQLPNPVKERLDNLDPICDPVPPPKAAQFVADIINSSVFTVIRDERDWTRQARLAEEKWWRERGEKGSNERKEGERKAIEMRRTRKKNEEKFDRNLKAWSVKRHHVVKAATKFWNLEPDETSNAILIPLARKAEEKTGQPDDRSNAEMKIEIKKGRTCFGERDRDQTIDLTEDGKIKHFEDLVKVIVIMAFVKAQETKWSMRWQRWRSSIRILFCYSQILYGLPSYFSLALPAIFTYAVDKVYGILSLQLFSQLSGIHCIIPSNFYVSLLLTTLVPIFLAICIGFKFHLTPSHETDKRAFWAHLFFILTYLVLPTASTRIFQIFACSTFDHVDYEVDMMVADLSLECYTTEYEWFLLYALLMLLVYPVGIPVMYGILLSKSHHEIRALMHAESCLEHGETSHDLVMVVHHEARQSERSRFYLRGVDKRYSSLNDFGNDIEIDGDQGAGNHRKSCLRRKYDETVAGAVSELSNIRFLFESYKPDRCWWEIAESARRLLLTCVLLIFKQGSAAQLFTGIWICFIFLMAYLHFQPFKEDNDGRLAFYAQLELLLILVVGILTVNMNLS